MRGMYWWAAATLLVLGPQASAVTRDTVQLRADVEGIAFEAPCRLMLRDAIFQARIDSELADETPWVTFEGGDVYARVFWANATVVTNPITGELIWRHADYQASDDVDFAPTQVRLLRPLDSPDVRITVGEALRPMVFPHADQLRANVGSPADGLPEPRALSTTTDGSVLDVFKIVPQDSGWLDFKPHTLEGPGKTWYLFDGWLLELSDGNRTERFETGVHEMDEHTIYQGGHVKRVYSFVVITVNDGRHIFNGDLEELSGFVPAPMLSWDGVATLRVNHGDVQAGNAGRALQQEDVRLEGAFRGDLRFPTELGVRAAQFEAVGTGSTSALTPQSGVALGPLGVAREVGIWGSLALGAVTMSLVGLHTMRVGRRPPTAATAPPSAPKPPAPADLKQMTLDGLIETVRREPLNGDAQFQLGVQLMKIGEDHAGMRHLDRSFRLQPGSILRLLEDPDLASIRDRSDVRLLLGQFHREQQRRIWAGYA